MPRRRAYDYRNGRVRQWLGVHLQPSDFVRLPIHLNTLAIMQIKSCLIANVAVLCAVDVVLRQAVTETYFGRTVAVVPDCDSDNKPDFVVGMGFAREFTGTIQIWSSASLAPIFSINGTSPASGFGLLAIRPVVDIDGDGIGKFIVGRGKVENSAEVVSMGKRRSLYQVAADAPRLLVSCDLNADSKRDL